MPDFRLQGIKLLTEATEALSIIEANGFRVDTEQIQATDEWATKRIGKLTERLKSGDEWAMWERTFGAKADLGSPDQLSVVLFDKLGHTPFEYGKHRAAVDESTLEKLNIPFLKTLLDRRKLEKLKSTYLTGIMREVDELGFVHPSFNLNLVRTFRSSADSPNLQNIPIRNPMIGMAIRRCFIPRDGHVLVEMDYSGVEVRCAAWYTQDPMLMRYIEDPTTDMHRDMAAECYLLEPGQVEKIVRSMVKGLFVFAEFYGDVYFSVARGLWEAIGMHNLKVGEVSLYDHLRSKGINECGDCNPRREPKKNSFEAHIKAVEGRFWGERFKRYSKWKKDIYDLFQRQGHIDTLSGFRLNGPATRNEILNAPIQGTAFHCLLWSLTKANKWLTKNGFRSKIVCQIHDSIIIDAHADEVDEVVPVIRDIMTKKIRKQYPFICTPLEVEAEACGLGESWHDKKKMAL